MPSKSAGKVWIEDIVNGEFVKSEGYEPSILRTKFGEEFIKVRVMGTIVEKFVSEQGDYVVITLDDSTETIQAKLFKEDVRAFAPLKEGDLIDIIGELREYDKEIYIHPRSVQKLGDPNWELLRNFEILQRRMKPRVEVKSRQPDTGAPEPGNKKEQPTSQEPIAEEALNAVKALDDGDGASLDDVLKNLKEYDESVVIAALRVLLSKGDLFEPKKEMYRLV